MIHELFYIFQYKICINQQMTQVIILEIVIFYKTKCNVIVSLYVITYL